MLRGQSRVLRCAQSASRILTAAQNVFLTHMLRSRTTAQQQLINALVHTVIVVTVDLRGCSSRMTGEGRVGFVYVETPKISDQSIHRGSRGRLVIQIATQLVLEAC